jgi:hypothetical protein
LTSAIDETKPSGPIAYTADVRANFTRAKIEIESLQTVKLADAPLDGKSYGRLSASWSQVLPIVGGTLTGPLILSADPATALGASTKQYTDTKLPLAGGTLTGALVLAADPGTNLGAATKQYADTKVPLAGGTMVGLLILSADPAALLGAATKQYADTKLARSGGTITGAVIFQAAVTTQAQVTMLNLPTVAPTPGTGIVWNNGGVLCVA